MVSQFELGVWAWCVIDSQAFKYTRDPVPGSNQTTGIGSLGLMASRELPAAPLCCGATLPACSSGSLFQVNCTDKYGEYGALMLAANKGHEGICQLLLDCGAEVTAALNHLFCGWGPESCSTLVNQLLVPTRPQT